jgi:hypothetical protein
MGKDNVVGVICGDKISTVLQWMLEEWIRLLKQANSEPEVRNIMTEKLVLKLEELEFTEDEAAQLKAILLLAKRLADIVPSPTAKD